MMGFADVSSTSSKVSVGDVGDIDEHPQPIEFTNDFAAKWREAAMPRRDTGRVRPVVRVVPGQRQVARPPGVEALQLLERVLDRVSALDADHDGQLAGRARGADPCRVRDDTRARLYARSHGGSRRSASQACW